MTALERIRRLWSNNGDKGRQRRRLPRNVISGGETSEWAEGTPMYPASSITTLTSDFLGDWRAADSWMRFDMWRVRNRSRQLERGNPWCIGFKRNMLNNVFGYKGYHWKPNVLTSTAFGDDTDGEPDQVANAVIRPVIDEFGQAKNFTTRKILNRNEVDRLLLSRLMFDGEFIMRKVRGFPYNDFNFAWQIVNPDYLDQNLNSITDSGNFIKMGVEFNPTYHFPVAYHFFAQRPNDFQYSWQGAGGGRYIRVPASEVIHVYLCTEDDEQTRGWPWLFAAVVTLFRQGKYQEAALVNAAIGACRGVYFEKDYPEGITSDEITTEGDLIMDMPQGSALELPVGTHAKVVDMKYPDGEFKDFNNAMLLTTSSVFGTSYATTTGDLSQANFVSSRLGQIEEHEYYRFIQQWFVDRWKKPGYDEELFRSMLVQKIKLPIAKFDKFNTPAFAGRRWPFVQPVDDMKAKELQLNNNITSITDIIEETTQEDTEEVFKRIANDNALMEKYGLTRVSSPASKEEPRPPGDESGNGPGVAK